MRGKRKTRHSFVNREVCEKKSPIFKLRKKWLWAAEAKK